MKIKIFNENFASDVEAAVNKWLEENPDIEIVDIKTFATPMHEMCTGQPPTILNQWNEYLWTIVYKEEK